MKKVFAIFALAALVACGGSTSTEVKTDSTTIGPSIDSPVVTQDTNYYKELNKKRLKELADTTANTK